MEKRESGKVKPMILLWALGIPLGITEEFLPHPSCLVTAASQVTSATVASAGRHDAFGGGRISQTSPHCCCTNGAIESRHW